VTVASGTDVGESIIVARGSSVAAGDGLDVGCPTVVTVASVVSVAESTSVARGSSVTEGDGLGAGLSVLVGVPVSVARQDMRAAPKTATNANRYIAIRVLWLPTRESIILSPT
jgi:hypothetical protein